MTLLRRPPLSGAALNIHARREALNSMRLSGHPMQFVDGKYVDEPDGERRWCFRYYSNRWLRRT